MYVYDKEHLRMIEDLWYKNAVIYNIDLESFMDSDGDGTGDFEGLIRRLDYLHSLGVDAVWLAPFHPSPNRDNGYDVADYYGVDPRHGSSGDFVEFMHEARKRGIKVIIDLVVNHTSRDHPWFEEARSNPDSPRRAWYVWSEERPKDAASGIVFPGYQETTWTYDRKARAYYFHRFYEHQPDLNMDNPAVRQEVLRIMGYWLELGVAGFRVDAVPFIIESTGPGAAQGTKHWEYLDDFRDFMQWRANVEPNEITEFFGDEGDRIQMMFNFYVNQFLFYALATADLAPLVEALEKTRNTLPTTQWAQFLRNHDEIDLGRLSEEQRARVFERFGPDEHMQLYGRGIRRRLAPMLGDPRLIRLAYSLQFSLPGTPVLHYGDEIGMGDDLDLPQREAIRTPMQWTGETHGGFSNAERTFRPAISGGVYGYERVNVEDQRRDPDSLLNWMTTIIRVRHECPEIGWGTWRIVPTDNKHTLALCYDWHDAHVVVLHNFAPVPQEVAFSLALPDGDTLLDLLGRDHATADDAGAHRLTLDGYGYRWFRVGSLNYALRRTG
jgi:maltose alpha-D-glucosyltransferase / alpha-amylase